MRKSPNYFLLSKIDEVSFALLEPHALVIYNQVTNDNQVVDIAGEAKCLLIEDSKLAVVVGTKDGTLVRVKIN